MTGHESPAARARRLVRGPVAPGIRAAADRHVAALMRARHRFYPENAVAVEDPDMDEAVRAALGEPGETAEPIRPEQHYFLFPAVGGVFLLQEDDVPPYSLVGLDVTDPRVRMAGPCADLDGLVRALWRDQFPCARCGHWTLYKIGSSTAALLPVPHPPHVVVMALCRLCLAALDRKFPQLHFVFKTEVPDTTGDLH